ncbi:MAG: ribonuclease HII [Clostridia bacterium]|nr:ribonuclease HII [Clostridia bacterium]MBR5714212.1 ribonuclease HII [Clostridia bacterium]
MRVKQDERERLFELTKYEREYGEQGLSVCGMDEVGRGPLAGPVVTCCIIMPSHPLIEGVNDSKKLSEKKREKLFEIIGDTALAIGYGFCDEKVIDEINILNATKRAFAQAYADMGADADIALIDAVDGLDIPCRKVPIIHGDALSYSIACASIMAKVTRDRYMAEQSKLYPEYGFEKNKGYGTAAHIDALKKYGACPIHRRSFIKNFCPDA